MTAEEQKTSAERAKRANMGVPRKAEVSEAERELKMAERAALLLQVAAIEKYLGVKRRCKKCGEDI